MAIDFVKKLASSNEPHAMAPFKSRLHERRPMLWKICFRINCNRVPIVPSTRTNRQSSQIDHFLLEEREEKALLFGLLHFEIIESQPTKSS